MAKYQSYASFTTITAFLVELGAFAPANGWTIVTQTPTSLIMSKSGTVFEVTRINDATARMYATPPDGARNTNDIQIFFQEGRSYNLVSSGRSLLIGKSHDNQWGWGGLVFLNPVGITGGIGLIGNNGEYSSRFAISEPYSSTYYVNGAWTPFGYPYPAGSIVGLGSSDGFIANYQPMKYNAGLLPVPVYMFMLHTTTTSLRPVGCIENVFRTREAGVYAHGDIIVINGNDYVLVPHGPNRTLLIKLE